MEAIKLGSQLSRESDEDYEYVVKVDNERIETFVTHSPRKVEQWIKATEERNHLRLHRLISVLDVKWNQSTTRGQERPVAVLQLLVNTRCLVYRIDQNADNGIAIPDGLKEFLMNQKYTFVGVGVEKYKRKLDNEFALEVMNTVDLREWAARELEDTDLANFTLQRLVMRFDKKYIDEEKLMSVRTSDWENDGKRLTDEQVQYATLDAYVTFSIARILHSWYD